jgi:quercetin dioxygenase-like cupin family protein
VATPLGAPVPLVREEPPPRWVTVAPGITARFLVEGRGTAMMLYRIEAGTQFELHHHGFPEFGVILSGEGRVVLEGERRTVRAGDSYYLPPNVRHGFGTPDRGEPVVLVDVSSELERIEPNPSRDYLLALARAATQRIGPLVAEFEGPRA